MLAVNLKLMSERKCACNCGEYLTQRQDALGWRYLKGHRPHAGGHIATPRTRDRRAPNAAPVQYMSAEKALALFRADLDLTASQLALKEMELEAIVSVVDKLAKRRDALASVVSSISLLVADVSAATA